MIAPRRTPPRHEPDDHVQPTGVAHLVSSARQTVAVLVAAEVPFDFFDSVISRGTEYGSDTCFETQTSPPVWPLPGRTPPPVVDLLLLLSRSIPVLVVLPSWPAWSPSACPLP